MDGSFEEWLSHPEMPRSSAHHPDPTGTWGQGANDVWRQVTTIQVCVRARVCTYPTEPVRVLTCACVTFTYVHVPVDICLCY